MRFTKMHGAGNDYVYVDLFEERLDLGAAPALARAMSNRHEGIGADGLILLGPSGGADVSMVMFNADGSRAEMCGNGIRCLAKLAYERERSRAMPMRVETDLGIKEIELFVEGDRVTGARVDMGTPVLVSDLCELDAAGTRVEATCVSMGNPHAVLFVDDVDETPVTHLGPLIERHELVPERTNVEFVQVLDARHVRQRTWERGSGETLACGTGACAVGVAGQIRGHTGERVTVHLRGGDLVIEWDGRGPVYMTGPAVEVFEGTWPHGV
ncbi:MAG: diaminopimelate epimerase [Planctomycetota bacterium]|nr:diaminopimelate epimerase [Planctomycetota bacterium]